jgi:hypothetical protein
MIPLCCTMNLSMTSAEDSSISKDQLEQIEQIDLLDFLFFDRSFGIRGCFEIHYH